MSVRKTSTNGIGMCVRALWVDDVSKSCVYEVGDEADF